MTKRIVKTLKPIGTCNRTGTSVYPSELNEYEGYCPELDEDLYSFEFTPLHAQQTSTKFNKVQSS